MGNPIYPMYPSLFGLEYIVYTFGAFNTIALPIKKGNWVYNHKTPQNKKQSETYYGSQPHTKRKKRKVQYLEDV